MPVILPDSIASHCGCCGAHGQCFCFSLRTALSLSAQVCPGHMTANHSLWNWICKTAAIILTETDKLNDWWTKRVCCASGPSNFKKCSHSAQWPVCYRTKEWLNINTIHASKDVVNATCKSDLGISTHSCELEHSGLSDTFSPLSSNLLKSLNIFCSVEITHTLNKLRMPTSELSLHDDQFHHKS